jgi:hypothetical protein
VCIQNLIQQFVITPFNFVKKNFEFELGALWVRMMAKVQAVLVPFMEFTSFYNVSKTHNILALKLNPHSNPLMW